MESGVTLFKLVLCDVGDTGVSQYFLTYAQHYLRGMKCSDKRNWADLVGTGDNGKGGFGEELSVVNRDGAEDGAADEGQRALLRHPLPALGVQQRQRILQLPRRERSRLRQRLDRPEDATTQRRHSRLTIGHARPRRRVQPSLFQSCLQARPGP